MSWIHFSLVQIEPKELKDKMFWTQVCTHCQNTKMNSVNTTYCSDSMKYGAQRCDFCFDNCTCFKPCENWSKDKKEFFQKEGYMSHELFDAKGNKYPPSGYADPEYKPKSLASKKV